MRGPRSNAGDVRLYPKPFPQPFHVLEGHCMATRTFKIPNGAELTLSSDELARRLAAKGYDPRTGRPLH